MMQLNNQRINLNIMRAGACIAVIMVHLGQHIALPQRLQTVFDSGSSGVIVFFILSGYLVFLSYSRNEEQGKGIGKWLLKHLGRILPVYYVIIFVYWVYYDVILHSVPIDTTGIGWLRYIFCVNQVVPAEEGFWNNLGGTWTISAFMLYYIMVPLLYRTVKNYRMALCFFAGTYLLGRILEASTSWFRVVTFLYYFAIGIIIYYACKEKKEVNWTIQGLCLLLLLIVIDAQGGLKIGILISVMLVQSMNSSYYHKAVLACVNLISRYSYSIYLVHLFVLAVLENITLQNDTIFIGVFLLLTCAGSWGMYHIIEKPAAVYSSKYLS